MSPFRRESRPPLDGSLRSSLTPYRKQEYRLPSSYLTLDEVETLLGVVDLTTASGLRDRSILETFYSTGMRCPELIALHLDDIDPQRGLVVIRLGKGRKDQVVPIGRRALEWLEKYRID